MEAPMGDPTSLTEIASSLGTVSVEVEQLDQFNRTVGELAEGLYQGLEDVFAPLVEEFVNFAGGGLVEGSVFFPPYQTCAQQLGEFFFQAGQGLATLSAVSMLTGVHYLTGDAESADLLATVTDAFTPPPLPTDPAVWERLAANERAQQQQVNDEHAEFTEMVDRYQDGEIPTSGSDGEYELPYSDYYTSDPGPLRADGQTWARPPGWTEPDVQHVNRVDLPTPRETILDDTDLRGLIPDELRDEVHDAQDEWIDGDGDVPGTSDDDRSGGGRDPIL
jgi:hypothetical protein